MFGKGVVIHNQQAGAAGTERMMNQVKEALEPLTDSLHFHSEDTPGDAIAWLADEQNEMDTVWILGGDGTVHTCMDGIRQRRSIPTVGILPAGTCNDFARMLGIPLQPVQAAQAASECRIEKKDIGLYNDQAFTNFVGVGLIADASENINEQLKGAVGRLSYFLSAWQSIRRQEPFTYELTMDSETIRGEAVMILVCNGRFLGTAEFPSPQISIDDGILDILVVEEAGLQLFRDWMQRAGEQSIMHTESVRHYRSSAVNLVTTPSKEMDADGEIEGYTPVKLSLMHQTIPFLTAGASE
ncbi:diacylglycerol/lipid kinase family protein [Alkalicoccus urumqiensis]|uniref:diacylglycerol/lipid kinase family protein n=1 Tax=Alkalicoccus urumqiensis TaxID=1548213 RepID=UPI0015E5F793|nr:YegS/Rv2252/BmrU family lipid kinase [Alkalicoccus urumqiensis]